MSASKPPPGFVFTVEDLIDAEGGRLEAWEQRVRAGLVDDKEFLAILYRDLDEAIDHLQGDAPSYVDATEDAMTRTIVGFLVGRRYDASSEPFERGHVDIHVKSKRLHLKWNGEAKIHSNYDHALEGMRQLITRYASGAHHHGGFLLYLRRKNAALVERKWREKIVADTSTASCGTKASADDPVEWRFQTTHDHSSGRDYFVRHHIVLMHFAPKDESGRKSGDAYSDEEEADEDAAPSASTAAA